MKEPGVLGVAEMDFEVKSRAVVAMQEGVVEKELRELADKLEEEKKLKEAEEVLKVPKMGYLMGRLGKATAHRFQISIDKVDHNQIFFFFFHCFCFYFVSFLHPSILFLHVDFAYVQYLLLQVLGRSTAELKMMRLLL